MIKRASATLVFAAIVLPTPVMAKSVYDMYEDSFNSSDFDSNGSLNAAEFQNWGYGEGMNGMEISNAFSRSDVNGDGEVTAQEFVDNSPMT